MRGRLTADIKEEIRQRVDLVELASAHVSLKKAGRHYKGLCPFHQEKTPSFHIDRERGLWHCFGCGEGGDIFDFVMRISSLSFTEAAETLARRAGVRLERTRRRFSRPPSATACTGRLKPQWDSSESNCCILSGDESRGSTCSGAESTRTPPSASAWGMRRPTGTIC